MRPAQLVQCVCVYRYTERQRQRDIERDTHRNKERYVYKQPNRQIDNRDICSEKNRRRKKTATYI